MSDNTHSRASRGPRRRSDTLLTGRLVEHGAANYQFRSDQAASYFARLLTDRGERVLWGKDLERAIRNSQSGVRIDDRVGIRQLGRETVTVTERQRDAQGQVVRQSEQLAHRNRWMVEKLLFFAERARMARRVRDEQLDARAAVNEYPELKSTFLTIRAAKEFAAQRISNPSDRERFVDLVKGAIARSIHQGEPLPAVRMAVTTTRPGEQRPTILGRPRTR
ncbi:MAG TPA: hypothetical protein VGM84_19635 [Steroidobacteraceae bacterium]